MMNNDIITGISGKAANPKRVTCEEIFKQLKETVSAGYNNYYDSIVYYIHIHDDGTFAEGFDESDATFHVPITPDDYGLTPEEWAEIDDMAYFYDREELDDPGFAKVVDNLTEQVNAYLAELDLDDD